MDQVALRKAADTLWQARLAGHRLDALPANCRPQSLEEGYAVQDVMAALIGDTVAGWKIAATSEAGQRHIGVSEPLAGRLFDRFVRKDGAILAAGAMHMRVVEAEFAFRLGDDLPARGEPYGIEEVMTAVADLHLAIEVPDARFERFAEVGPASIVADDAFAGWFVLGRRIEDWRSLDLRTLPVRARLNGKPVGEGSGANVLGDPRRALTWIANDRARRGSGLSAGEIVTTGTCLTPIAIVPGDRVSVEFRGLGDVGVAFD
jgi:2-keto-4-pentenoate hydratase